MSDSWKFIKSNMNCFPDSSADSAKGFEHILQALNISEILLKSFLTNL